MLRGRIGFLISFIYIVGGVVMGIFLIEAENQRPWLIAIGIWFVVFATLSNWWIFVGSRRHRAKYNKKSGRWNE